MGLILAKKTENGQSQTSNYPHLLTNRVNYIYTFLIYYNSGVFSLILNIILKGEKK